MHDDNNCGGNTVISLWYSSTRQKQQVQHTHTPVMWHSQEQGAMSEDNEVSEGTAFAVELII